jgi:hypothetical protein
VLVVNQHGTRPVLVQILGDTGLGVGQETEHESFRGTRLNTSGTDFAVIDLSMLNFRINGAPTDSLNTESTFLHDALFTLSDIGVQDFLHRRRPFGISKVEHPYVVRTVVSANPSTDTTVIDLAVQPVVGMHGSKNGTHRLTGSRPALLTQHWNKVYVDVRKVAVMDPLDSEPVHQSTHGSLLCADDGDVILRPTSRDTSFAAGTLVDVDRHPPLIFTVELLHDFSLLLRQNVSWQVVDPLVEGCQQARALFLLQCRTAGGRGIVFSVTGASIQLGLGVRAL